MQTDHNRNSYTFSWPDISLHSSGKETGEIFFKLTLVLPTPTTPFRSNFETQLQTFYPLFSPFKNSTLPLQYWRSVHNRQEMLYLSEIDHFDGHIWHKNLQLRHQSPFLQHRGQRQGQQLSRLLHRPTQFPCLQLLPFLIHSSCFNRVVFLHH